MSAYQSYRDTATIPTDCRYCGGAVRMVRNREIYGRDHGRWPFAYLCGGCGAYVGVHPDTDVPLGTLANAQLRGARRGEKKHFEKLRNTGVLGSRGDAYRWLAAEMGITTDECHWGLFEVDQCIEAGKICKRKLREMGGP